MNTQGIYLGDPPQGLWALASGQVQLPSVCVPYVDYEPPMARRVDQIEQEAARLPQCEMPLVHRFTPGLYIRQITMPTGALVVSKIHKTEHPFVLSKGRAVVWDEVGGLQEVAAPFCGVTRPGTRRVIYIREECVWTTFHVTDLTDVEAIERAIIFERERQE